MKKLFAIAALMVGASAFSGCNSGCGGEPCCPEPVYQSPCCPAASGAISGAPSAAATAGGGMSCGGGGKACGGK